MDNAEIISILNQTKDIISSRTKLENLGESTQQQYAEIIGSFRSIPAIKAYCNQQFIGSNPQEVIDKFDLSVIQEVINDIEAQENRRTKPEKQAEPKQEDSTIPPELEALVAQYEDHLKEETKNDGKAHSVADAVKRAREAMLLRERLAAIRRNRAELSGNAATFNQAEDKRYEDLIIRLTDPKARNTQTLLAPTKEVVSEAVDSYIERYTATHPGLSPTQVDSIKKLSSSIVENTTYLALASAIDVTNRYDLITGIEVSLQSIAPTLVTPISAIYQEMNHVEQKNNDIDQEIYRTQLELSKLNASLSHASTKEAATAILGHIGRVQTESAQLETQKAQLATQVESKIKDTSLEIESHVLETTTQVIAGVKKPNGHPDRDFDSKTETAGKSLGLIQERLLQSGIEGKLPPKEDNLRTFDIERGIRREIPQLGIALNATFAGEQAATLLSDPKLRNQDLSAETVKLFSKGLDSKALDQVISHAEAHKDDKNSLLGNLYKSNPALFGQLRKQLQDIDATNSPEAIQKSAIEQAKANPSSTLGQLYSQNRDVFNEYIKLSKTLNPKQIVEYAKANPTTLIGNIYSTKGKVFSQMESELAKVKNSTFAKEIGRVLTPLSKTLNTAQSRIIGFADKAGGIISKGQQIVKIASNPVGFAQSYLGRKAGEYLAKKVISKISNEALRKSAEYLLKNGLKGTVKKFAEMAAKQAAKRIAAETAKLAVKTGVKVALETAAQAANAIPGLGILIAIAIEIVWAIAEATIGAFSKAWKDLTTSIYGSEVKFHEIAGAAAVGVGAAVTGAVAGTVGFFTAVAATTVVAATSAVGIIIIALLLGFFLYISSVVVAPMISTLAQLESTSAGQTGKGYTGPTNCSNVPWPFDGFYHITQGPNSPIGCSHSSGTDKEAVDFGTPIGTPIKSISAGTVASTGNSGDGYGEKVVVSSVTDSGQSYLIYYGHFSSITVSQGATVSPGDLLGLSGNTGDSTGPHLHLGYIGIPYMSCPVGGFTGLDGCCDSCPQP